METLPYLCQASLMEPFAERHGREKREGQRASPVLSRGQAPCLLAPTSPRLAGSQHAGQQALAGLRWPKGMEAVATYLGKTEPAPTLGVCGGWWHWCPCQFRGLGSTSSGLNAESLAL